MKHPFMATITKRNWRGDVFSTETFKVKHIPFDRPRADPLVEALWKHHADKMMALGAGL